MLSPAKQSLLQKIVLETATIHDFSNISSDFIDLRDALIYNNFSEFLTSFGLHLTNAGDNFMIMESIGTIRYIVTKDDYKSPNYTLQHNPGK